MKKLIIHILKTKNITSYIQNIQNIQYMNFIKEHFYLNNLTCNYLHTLTPSFGFNGIGSVIYYRTYSRIMKNGNQEQWADTVIRVINGVMSIRKDWYSKMHLPWDEDKWQLFATEMAKSMFNMHFLPSGRNLWAMGTDFVRERGSCALYNCAAVDSSNLPKSAYWVMDMLFNGVGVGIKINWEKDIYYPDKNNTECYIIEDSREGWSKSVYQLVNAYVSDEDNNRCKFPTFDYSKIRPKGSIIHSFNAKASGPEPLIKLHKQIEQILDNHVYGKISKTQLVADIFNHIGACIVSLSIRRSAEILLGKADDHIFINLKNPNYFPERQEWAWMSNNTIVLEKREDFQVHMPKIAENIIKNGEPGLMNLINIQKYGRYGQEMLDTATLCNPCSEIPLEPYEVCNLSEIFPTRCETDTDMFNAAKYATFYSSTVSLLPTHHPETNLVIAKNRRIGVSISGIADLRDKIGSVSLIRSCRELYKLIRKTNKQYAQEAGVPESIRVTTIKPSGTLSLLTGVTPGMHYPTHNYAIRRIRISKDQSIIKVLKEANIPFEDDVYANNTLVFEFPIKSECNTRSAKEVSAYEQFSLLATMQREYSDNMVSCTIYFDKEKESNMIKNLLAEFIPVIKSVSLLPHSDEGSYKQMPLEGITVDEYNRRLSEIKEIDWKKFNESDGMDEMFCSNDQCSL